MICSCAFGGCREVVGVAAKASRARMKKYKEGGKKKKEKFKGKKK